MSLVLPVVYPITDTRISGLSHLEQVARLADGGARFVQLREKSISPREFYATARAVIDFARPLGIKIIINDRVDIALAAEADGVHLGQDDLPVEYARKLLGEKAIVGFSTHSVEQAAAAAKMPIDYIAIGPVFETATKKKPDPVVGLETVSAARAAVGDIPLVAIGGINHENYVSVLNSGAASVAIISDLWNHEAGVAAFAYPAPHEILSSY